jgi:hypothetical protein
LCEFLMGRSSQPPPSPQAPPANHTGGAPRAVYDTDTGVLPRAVRAVLDYLRRAIHLRRRSHPPHPLPAFAVAASTVARGHPVGACLLIAAAVDDTSIAAWVGHRFA